mmetsp:Transcript_15737/g.33287  ORF Transcript_15737/g.33287 Transcript_15737/m.33287 type:complete len:162 (-) Transcript_15737:442-927(-)
MLTPEAKDLPLNLRGRELANDNVILAVEFGNKGWQKVRVSNTKRSWFIDNGAKTSCVGKLGETLTNYQRGNKHYYCEFSSTDVCTVKAPRKMKDFMLDSGVVGLHKCGKGKNPDPKTPTELQIEYIEPCSAPTDTVELCIDFVGQKIGICWRYQRIQRHGF